MSAIENKLNEMGIALPKPPAPAGNYLPYRRHGNLLVVAGTICMINGQMTHTGKVGESQTVQTGYEAAKVCALNALAIIKDALGSLDNVEQFVSVSGFVNAVAGFSESPAVINGASDLFGNVFGEAGKHARVAMAVAGLPRDSTVEVQVMVAVKEIKK